MGTIRTRKGMNNQQGQPQNTRITRGGYYISPLVFVMWAVMPRYVTVMPRMTDSSKHDTTITGFWQMLCWIMSKVLCHVQKGVING